MSSCRICGGSAVAGRYTVPEMIFGTREEFAYFQCDGCQCLQIEEIPQHLERYYAGEYYSYMPAQRRTNALKRWSANARHRFALHGRDPLGWLLYRRAAAVAMRSLRLFRLQSQTRVLDVGCGAGLIIYDLAELGYQGMLGIDPFIERDLHYSNGARVRKVGIEDVTGKWDLLMFHHSFEHMPDPAATLRRVHDLLEVGGHCLLRVPTVSSFAWQHYGTEWVQLDAPRHLYLFSRPSIERLAAANGFELVNVTYDSDAFQFWGSEQYRRGIPLKSELSYAVNPTAATFTAKQMLDFSRRAKKLNRAGQGDQAAFYLRKLSP